MKCEVEECDRPSYCGGLCGLHYKRKWRHGNVQYTERPANPVYLMECGVDDCTNLVGEHGANGYCSAHYNRMYKYNRLHRVIASRGEGTTNSGGYRVIPVEGKPTYEHIHLAEKALGRKLPPSAIVHHTTRDRSDNHGPFKLVICPDQSYHMLLHYRAKILGYE